MTKVVRYLLFFIGVVQLFFALAFFRQMPLATNLWPFEGTTPLTFIFISSIFAAAAAPTLWAAASGTYGALAGIGLDYLMILAPVSILSFKLATSSSPQMTAYGIACVFGALFGLGLFGWSARIPLDRTISMPRPVWWAFIIFIIALLIVSIQLILKVPNVIPWKITPELSLVIGWMFLGAAVYFAYGLLRPGWLNAAGQLIGFLAYDVVLIVPFVTRLPATAPEFRLGLIVYTAVVTLSGLLAIFYLFLHKPTREQTWMRSNRA
ncbi:MAG: hypothetical protein P8183_03065 [Anaerolineae bacterium]